VVAARCDVSIHRLLLEHFQGGAIGLLGHPWLAPEPLLERAPHGCLELLVVYRPHIVEQQIRSVEGPGVLALGSRCRSHGSIERGDCCSAGLLVRAERRIRCNQHVITVAARGHGRQTVTDLRGRRCGRRVPRSAGRRSRQDGKTKGTIRCKNVWNERGLQVLLAKTPNIPPYFWAHVAVPRHSLSRSSVMLPPPAAACRPPARGVLPPAATPPAALLPPRAPARRAPPAPTTGVAAPPAPPA